MFNFYIMVDMADKADSGAYDTLEDCKSDWDDSCEDTPSGVTNRYTVYHITDDCPARNVSDDWLEAMNDERMADADPRDTAADAKYRAMREVA
jgi:hypothetical protein